MPCRYLLLLPLASSLIAQAQEATTPDATRLSQLSEQYISSVSHKAKQNTRDIDKQTARYLDKLQKQENKLRLKLAAVDSLAAHNIFANSATQYQQLQNEIKNKSERLTRGTGLYLPYTDTALSSLRFLSDNPLTGKLPVSPAQMKNALDKVKELEAQLRQAENVKEFIRQRRDYLRQQLARYDLGKDLKKFNSTAYYYGQQIQEYKAALNDETKAEQKALALLRNYTPFRQFLERNGALAGLFNIPGSYSSTGMGGLQTISQVQDLLASRIRNLGPNAAQTVSQTISQAQSELSKLRNHFPQLGDAADIPGFQPDEVKTKSLKKRLLFGLDMQSTRGNSILPNYTDIGLSMGVRLSKKWTAGIGASYKLGYGKDIGHIRFSSEGLGLRSYLDMKLRKSFYLSAGAELNYLSAFSSLKELQDYGAWKKSALAGVSKTVSLKSRVFKNTKVSLMYDFLHAMQVPQSRQVIFRAGYLF